ncbi:MAG: DUF4037 domain-containing protein [Treponema sp.]|nr:DUF4037 domain-containing protein [Treponema sp.]
MKYKTKLLADRFTGCLSQWTGVECISLNEAAFEDTLDPYFALIFDIFYSEPIPGAEERWKLFGGDVSAFETSGGENKDRFLIGNIPVRMEYKSIYDIEKLITLADTKLESLWLVKDSGTYGYYRLAYGEILYDKSGWIGGVRTRLKNLGDGFWEQMRFIHESKMEHSLNDLGAALFQGDDYYYLISSALFIKYACLTLFCINHRFEPSHRAYYRQALELPVLPDSFRAQLESFLHGGAEATNERKYALAQLIAKGIIVL